MKHPLRSPKSPSFPPHRPDSDQRLLTVGRASRDNERMILHAESLWGYLQPCKGTETSIEYFEFAKGCEEYHIALPFHSKRYGKIIEAPACIFIRKGEQGPIVFLNLSKNFQVYVDKKRVYKKDQCDVEQGTIISFSIDEDTTVYRYRFHDATIRRPSGSFYAHYDVVKVLGSGGYSTVLSVIHHKSRKRYAAKKITRLNNGPTFEIACMKMLHHPNICQLKEVFYQKDNSITIVLELFEKGTLNEYIYRRPTVTEDCARRVTYQICTAMSYVHSKGIVHRDLKPENILMSSVDPPMVKISDFGLAKGTDRHGLLASAKGTEWYAAPEVFCLSSGIKGYSNLVDSWSVGAIVLSMLIGEYRVKLRVTHEYYDREPVNKKVSNLKMNLDALVGCGYDVNGRAHNFTRSLLVHDPSERTSLTAARFHPWLIKFLRNGSITSS